MLRLETCSKAEDVTTQPFLHLGGHVTTSYQWTMSGGDVWHFQEEVAKKRVPPVDVLLTQNLGSPGEMVHPGLGGGRTTRWKEPGSQAPDQRHQMFKIEINSSCVKFRIYPSQKAGLSG